MQYRAAFFPTLIPKAEASTGADRDLPRAAPLLQLGLAAIALPGESLARR
jgi:hypothetical protein